MQVASEAVAAAAPPRVLGQHPAPRRARDELPARRPRYRLWKAGAARRPGRSGDRARGRPRAGAHPRLLGRAAASWPREFATDAIFFDIRLEPYLLATAQRHPDLAPQLEALVAATRRRHAWRWCTATSARRTSWSAPQGRCCSMPNARGGATRRSTSRSASTTCCSSACGIRGATAAFLASFDALAARLPARASTGSRATALERRAAALLPGLLARARRRQVAGRVLTDEAQRERVRRVARRAARRAGRSLSVDRRRLARGARRMNARDDPFDPRPPRLGQPRPADGRGRGDAARRRGRAGDRAGRRVARARARRIELRDGGARSAGSTCMQAVGHVNGEIARALVGRGGARPGRARPTPDRARRHAEQDPPRRQRDARGVDGRGARGGGVAAACRCTNTSAAPSATLLPMPQIQIFGGGAHAGRRVDIQDFMVVCPGARELRRGARMDGRGLPPRRPADAASAGSLHGVADEGGWWPDFDDQRAGARDAGAAIERAGFAPGAQVAIALDIAASEFGRGGRYTLGLEARELDSDGLIELLLRWIDKYPDRLDRGPARRGRRRGLRPLHARRRRAGADRRRRLPGLATRALVREAAGAAAPPTPCCSSRTSAAR